MPNSPYMTVFAVMWFSAAAILILWFFWRDRKEQKRRDQQWQEREERKREAQQQRQQHLKERHALILRTRQQRMELEMQAMKLVGRMHFDEKRITENELDIMTDAICVEYEKLSMEMVHHENLYLGLSDEADKASKRLTKRRRLLPRGKNIAKGNHTEGFCQLLRLSQ